MRVAVVEDSGLFREALTGLLRDLGHEVVVAVGEPARLPDDLAGIDVAILDIRLPPTFTTEGLAIAARMRSTSPGTGVLVLSTYADGGYACELLDACPERVGYLLKDRVAGGVALQSAMERVAAGEVVLDAQLVHSLVRRHAGGLVEALTEREREVLALLAQGRSNAGISGELYLATKTIERHVAAIFDKLGLEPSGRDNRRVHATLLWLRQSPVTPGRPNPSTRSPR